MDLECIKLSEVSQRKTNTILLHLYVESKEQFKQTKQKQTQRYREHFDSSQKGVGLVGGWVKKEKELRSADWQLQNSDRYVKYSVGNTVNKVVRTMHGAKWGLEVVGEHFVKYMIV